MVLTFLPSLHNSHLPQQSAESFEQVEILIPDGGQDASGVTAEPSWMHLRDGSLDYAVIHCTLFQD